VKASVRTCDSSVQTRASNHAYEPTNFGWAAIRSFLPKKPLGIPRIDDRRVPTVTPRVRKKVGGFLARDFFADRRAAASANVNGRSSDGSCPASTGSICRSASLSRTWCVRSVEALYSTTRGYRKGAAISCRKPTNCAGRERQIRAALYIRVSMNGQTVENQCRDAPSPTRRARRRDEPQTTAGSHLAGQLAQPCGGPAHAIAMGVDDASVPSGGLHARMRRRSVTGRTRRSTSPTRPRLPDRVASSAI
jgi:hypothetical protein